MGFENMRRPRFDSVFRFYFLIGLFSALLLSSFQVADAAPPMQAGTSLGL
jgi:hypothetical protein